MEVPGGFREIRFDQFAVVVSQRRAGGAHRLVFTDGKYFHLDAAGIERGRVVDHGLHHADGPDTGGGRGIDGACLAGDPVGGGTHQAGREGIDRLALIDGCHGGGEFRGARYGAAR